MSSSPSATPRVAIDQGPALVWGFYSDQDWQRSLNGLASYDAIDAMIGAKQSATSPQLSWAWGTNADGTPRYQPFYAQRLDADRQRHRISVLTWMSMNGGDRTNPAQIALFNNENILKGTHDAYVRQWAADAAAYGHKFVVRFNPEMNGWWEGPFSEYDANGNLANGNTAGSFVRAWQHVYNLVHPIAPNVLWYWCANPVDNTPSHPTYAAKLAHFYPGDVDFVGLDIYNKASDDGEPWLTFAECMEGRASGYPANSVAPLLALAPGKPWILGEVGCAPATAGDTTPGAGDRAAWIKGMFDAIRTRYPFVRIVQWYDVGPYAIDAAAAVGFNQGAQGAAVAPLLDPEAFTYRVVTTPDVDAQLAAAQLQVGNLTAQLGAANKQATDALASAAAARAQVAQLQQAEAQVTGALQTLRTFGVPPT